MRVIEGKKQQKRSLQEVYPDAFIRLLNKSNLAADLKYDEISKDELVRIMNINSKIAEYLTEKLEYLSFDTDNEHIKMKYLIGEYKIDCNINAESITLICKD